MKRPQYLALQLLTRHRLHLVECITREKAYMVSNIFLKFSELAVLKEGDHPFSSNHTATADAILTEMLSLEYLIRLSYEDLVEFVCSHSKNCYSNLAEVCKLLKKLLMIPIAWIRLYLNRLLFLLHPHSIASKSMSVRSNP